MDEAKEEEGINGNKGALSLIIKEAFAQIKMKCTLICMNGVRNVRGPVKESLISQSETRIFSYTRDSKLTNER